MAFFAPIAEFATTVLFPKLALLAEDYVIPIAKEGVKLAAGSAVIGTLFALSGEAVHEVVRKIKTPTLQDVPIQNRPSRDNIINDLPLDELPSKPINIPKKRNGDNYLLDDLIKQLNRKVYKDPSIVKKY